MTGQPAILSGMERIGKRFDPAAVLAKVGLPPDSAIEVERDERERDEDRAARAALQRANQHARWAQRLPVMYEDASVDQLGPDQHRDAVRAWLHGPGSTLFLAGSVGAGKTFAAYAVARAADEAGAWVEAWTVADLMEALRPAGDPAVRDIVRACDLLLLDDLSVVKVSEWAQEQLNGIIDERLRQRRRQIITTNVTYTDLSTGWGERTMDRLSYRMTALDFAGPSRRQAAW